MKSVALAFLLLTLPVSMYSQAPADQASSPAQQASASSPSETASSSSSVSAEPIATPATSAQSSTVVSPVKNPWKHDLPIVSTAVGFNYLQTNLTDVGGARPATYTMGWYVIEQANVSKHFGIMAESTNTYNWHAGAQHNLNMMTAGPVYRLPSKWVSAYAFAEGGAVRTEYSLPGTRAQSYVNWDAAAVGGIGMNYRLTRRLAFQVIPGEYIATKNSNGDWESNYDAKAGFVLNFYGNR